MNKKASEIQVEDRIWHTSAGEWMTVDDIQESTLKTWNTRETNYVFSGLIDGASRKLHRTDWQNVTIEPESLPRPLIIELTVNVDAETTNEERRLMAQGAQDYIIGYWGHNATLLVR